MKKQKVTILLLGLICFSSISGVFTVICHGSDGHANVEHFFHEHCDCSEYGENGRQKDCNDPFLRFSKDHTHCTDIPTASGVHISLRKNKIRLAKIFLVRFHLRSNPNCLTHSFRLPIFWNTELFSFFTPLRSIILLA